MHIDVRQHGKYFHQHEKHVVSPRYLREAFLAFNGGRKLSFKILVSGFGNVGRSLAKLLAWKYEDIRKQFGLEIKVVGITDSRGGVLKEDGFERSELLKLCEVPRGHLRDYSPYGHEVSTLDLLEMNIADTLVEVTPSNYESGEPSMTHTLKALELGHHVVLAAKPPLALNFKKVMKLAKSKGIEVKYEATVMGGTPTIHVLRGLRCYEISNVEGILNRTTNYILAEMYENLISFEEALSKAQTLGIAEPDPTLDVDGWDAAAKLVIAVNTLGFNLKLNEVKMESARNIALSNVLKFRKKNMMLRQVAKFDHSRKQAEVKLEAYPSEHIFAEAGSRGLNALTVKTGAGEVTIVGVGAGGLQTAHSILGDIIEVSEIHGSH